MAITSCIGLLQKDCHALFSKAKKSKSTLEQLKDLDNRFMEDTKLLYKTISKRAAQSKKCSKKCEGILLEYDYQESQLNQEILGLISANRTQCEVYYENDPVDSLSCVSGLRIERILGYLEGKEPDEAFIASFYDTLDMLDADLSAFPPAKTILSNVANTIGSCY